MYYFFFRLQLHEIMPLLKRTLFYIQSCSEVISPSQCSTASAHQVAESLYDVKLLLPVTLNYLTVGDRNLHMNRSLPEENLFIRSQHPPSLHQSTKQNSRLIMNSALYRTGHIAALSHNGLTLRCCQEYFGFQYVLEDFFFLTCSAKRHSLLLISHHLQINQILRGECHLFSKESF